MSLPDGVDIPHWAAWLIIAGATIGALRAMVRTRVARWIKDAVARSITEAVRIVVKEEVAPLWDELSPNGGLSARDAIDRTEQYSQRIETKLAEHVEHSEQDREYLHRRLNGTIQINELDDPED